LVGLSKRPAVPQYLGLIAQSIAFAINLGDPKYWGTWQLRISYRLEENDMTGDKIKSGSP
jgi:hypothetical protein